MLPEFSTEISDTNFGNTFKIEIYFLKKQPKSVFSMGRFGGQGGAPGRKFFFDAIRIGQTQNPMASQKFERDLPSPPELDFDKPATDFDGN